MAKSSTSYNSETGREAAKKQKRGIGVQTKFKNMLNAAQLSEENLKELANDVLQGKYGEQAVVQVTTEAMKLGHQQELIDYKAEVDIQKHKAMREVDRDFDAQLVEALTKRFGKELDFNEVKRVIDKMTGGNDEDQSA